MYGSRSALSFFSSSLGTGAEGVTSVRQGCWVEVPNFNKDMLNICILVNSETHCGFVFVLDQADLAI
jgi:hypothetical protein